MNAKRFLSVILSWIALLSVSCSYSNSNFHLQEGRAEVVSISTSALNDSSVFEGYVYDLSHEPPDYPVQDAQLWMENSSLLVTPDSSGYYFIKTVPGAYTIKCERNLNNWPELVEQVKKFEIHKNEVARIDFYLGFADE